MLTLKYFYITRKIIVNLYMLTKICSILPAKIKDTLDYYNSKYDNVEYYREPRQLLYVNPL